MKPSGQMAIRTTLLPRYPAAGIPLAWVPGLCGGVYGGPEVEAWWLSLR